MDDKIFKQDAKTMVDTCFDKRLFSDNLSRDDMTAFEEWIAFTLQSRFDSYIRIENLLKSLKDKP